MVLTPTDQPSAEERSDVTPLPQPAANLLPRFIRAEANFLRLPLFALQTKGLRTLDGIECRGTITRNGERHDFTLKASRSTASPYPGPLARAAHLAFLSIATERGSPIVNPIPWRWRDLCRRMGIGGSGRDIQQLKAAIRSTALLGIDSQYAIYSKADSRMIRSQEEVLHFYERVAFVGSELPGGGIADANYVWLADWYLGNLNAMFTAPLDYELWRTLDRQSPIASRLYEFLFLNFYSGAPVLRFGYEKLAQYLPVRPERYRSQAIQQLGPAFELLRMAGIVSGVTWAESKNSLARLHIHRGKAIDDARDQRLLPFEFAEDEAEETFEVREIRDPRTPEAELVTEFYRLWAGDGARRPTQKELEQAQTLIGQHGAKKAKDSIPRVVKRLKENWPDAKTFGAISPYIPEVIADMDRDEQRRGRERGERIREELERQEQRRQRAEEATFLAAWKPVWDALGESEREEIRLAALSGPNRHLHHVPRLAEKLCLTELARRRG